MLTREQNELITRVGPGTPMGEALRRYWMPILLSDEFKEPDGPPVRVKILGEELVAFRDTEGRVGLVDEFCAHRCASLFLGRNEEGGLRCVFHGWKYDVEGRCIDMPNEPAPAFRWTDSGGRDVAGSSALEAPAEGSGFKENIRLAAYPTAEVGGLIWAYLGPPEKRPPLPAMEWLRAPESHRYVSRTMEFCNYVQGIEGGIDTVHSMFLHGGVPPARRGGARASLRQESPPQLEVERTDYGFRYAGVYLRVEDDGTESAYVRMYQFVMPFQQFRAQQASARGRGSEDSVPQVRGHLWAPIDDETTWVYNWMYACDPDKPFTPELVLQSEVSSGRGPDGEAGYQRKRVRANDWLIDREMQRNENFTGIFGINSQDLAVQESMGPIVDRSREHLGTTDKAIVMMRYLLLAAIKDVQEGLDPPGVDPASYQGVRAADVVLPRGARWQEAAADLLVARR